MNLSGFFAAAVIYLLRDAVSASEAQERLISELFLSRNYNKLERPVSHIDEVVQIVFGLTLNILVVVDDKEQGMRTNGYLDMTWDDKRFLWNPEEYGGITVLRLPIAKIWQPDIVLTNTLDKQFFPNFNCNALIYNTGSVQWVPPFIYKSGCDTNPIFFPFDHQMCNMVFRSVTYDALKVDLVLKTPNMELKDYCEQPSGTWDLADVPLQRFYRTEWRQEEKVPVVFVQLDMKVARKSQFYVVTFLIPCVCIAFLTIFIFYLPSSAGEKVCLATSILFSIVVFLLILVEVLPPSDSLPLMTKFLVFTFICNLASMFITIITINFNYRSPETYEMSKFIKVVFLEFLPVVLRIRRPDKKVQKKLFEPKVVVSQDLDPYRQNTGNTRRRWDSRSSRNSSRKLTTQSSFERMLPLNEKGSPLVALRFPEYPHNHNNASGEQNHANPTFSSMRVYDSPYQSGIMREVAQLGDWMATFHGYPEALNNVAFIAKKMEQQEDDSDVADDWKYIALVIDRLLLWVFFIGNAFGSASILLNSPHLFEPLIDHCPPNKLPPPLNVTANITL